VGCGRDNAGQRRSAGFGDLLVLLGGVAADSDCADHSAIHEERDATLERGCTREHQRCDPTFANLVLEDFARPAEDRRRPRLADSHLHARHLGVVQPLQEEDMASVVHHDDHHGGPAFQRFRFRGSPNLLRRFQCQHRLHRKFRTKRHLRGCGHRRGQ
jgi:hypothetical protein